MITEANSGIGLASAKLFVAEGAQVVMAGRNKAAIEIGPGTDDIPMGRLGRPEETAQAALFLASNESSFITAIDLCDGGMGRI